jgi:hypothetical protein
MELRQTKASNKTQKQSLYKTTLSLCGRHLGAHGIGVGVTTAKGSHRSEDGVDDEDDPKERGC